MQDDKVIHTIRHLFAMAEHETSNEHEAAIALEKAQALLLKHNLDRASIGGVDTGPTVPSMGKITVTEEHGYPWRKRLINVIAVNNLCKVIANTGHHAVDVFGTRDNVRSVLEMYNWLAEQIIRLAGPGHKEYKRQGGHESARTWNTGFYHGAINTLSQRLKKPLEEFSQGQGTAIVLANKALLDAAVHRVYPHTKTSRVSTSRIGDGYFSGTQAGGKVTLGRSRPLASGRLAIKGVDNR